MSDDPETVRTDVPDTAALWAENQRLQGELEEAHETLRAIRTGEVDAIVVAGQDGDQVFSLSGAESVYRLIFNTMQEAALTVTPDGTILSCNPQFETLIKTSGWVIGRPLEAFVAPEERTTLATLLVRSQREPVRQRLVFRATDGAPVSAHVSAQAIPQPEGLCICLVATDLTALEASLETLRQIREQQEALRQSEERFRLASSATNDAIWDWNLLDGTVSWNDTYARTLGRPPEARTSWQWWMDHIHPDDRERVVASLQAAQAGTATLWTAAYRFRRVDGTWADIQDRAAIARDATGRAWRIVGAMLDVTERNTAEAALRLSEEKFARTFQHAPVGMSLVAVTTGQYLDVNETFCQMLGYGREEVVGRSAADLRTFHQPSERADLLADLERTGAVRAREVELVRKSGAVFPALLSLDRIAIHDDTFFLGTVTDISARKQAEAALQYAHAQLERRVEERTLALAKALTKQAAQAEQLRALTGELTLAEERERQRLAHVLHDGLQQFLVAARLRIQLLERMQGKDFQTGCREISNLLEEAIRSSRSLTAELSPPVLHTAGFVPALQWLAHWMADTHRLTVTVQADPAVRVEADAPKVLLFQAVRELLLNVVKHAGVAQAEVDVTAQADSLQLRVTDHGKGFTPDQAQPLGGSGLGLASVRQRLVYLGGTLAITSAPGQGSRFTLTVPLQP